MKSGEGMVMSSPPRVMVTLQEVNETFHMLTLEFRGVEILDTGAYSCHASNRVPSTELSATDTSQEFYLFVQSE